MHLRTLYNGYANYGKSRIPVLPTRSYLTDREDGALWLLSHDSTEGYVSINDAVLSRLETLNRTVFGAFDGPYVVSQTGEIARLLVRDGYLGFEFVVEPPVTSQSNQRVLTRRANERHYIEVREPAAGYDLGEPTLAYEIVL